MTDDTTATLGKLLGMVVHDLRNPGATIGANVSYVREVLRSHPDEDLKEALQDVERALGDLMLGLEQVAWVGRWLSGEAPTGLQNGDVREALKTLRPPPYELHLEVHFPDEPLLIKGGGKAINRLTQMFVENAVQHARRGRLDVIVRREGEEAVIEILDDGAPLDPEFHRAAFTLEGQLEIKGKAQGRYGRVGGLLAAKVLADAIGASLEAGVRDGRNLFRIRAPLL